jgi:hypothetical protein
VDDLAVLEHVERVRRVVRRAAGGVELGQRVGERERDALVLGDRRAEGLALLRPVAVRSTSRSAAPQQRAAMKRRSTRIHSFAPGVTARGTRFASGTRQS